MFIDLSLDIVIITIPPPIRNTNREGIYAPSVGQNYGPAYNRNRLPSHKGPMPKSINNNNNNFYGYGATSNYDNNNNNNNAAPFFGQPQDILDQLRIDELNYKKQQKQDAINQGEATSRGEATNRGWGY